MYIYGVQNKISKTIEKSILLKLNYVHKAKEIDIALNCGEVADIHQFLQRKKLCLCFTSKHKPYYQHINISMLIKG